MLVTSRVVRGAPLGLRLAAPAAASRLRLASTASSPSYTERQAATGRPVSPHLTIYKFPVAAISSISTRITGVAMTAGVAGIGGLALVGADVPAVVAAFQTSCPALVPVAKACVAFPLSYHYLSALRHTVSRAARRGARRADARGGRARRGRPLTRARRAPRAARAARSTGT